MGAQVEVPGLTVRSCDLGLQPPYLASRWDGFTYLPRYFPPFTFDESKFSSMAETRETTKVHSYLSHSTMFLRPGSGWFISLIKMMHLATTSKACAWWYSPSWVWQITSLQGLCRSILLTILPPWLAQSYTHNRPSVMYWAKRFWLKHPLSHHGTMKSPVGSFGGVKCVL